MVSALVRSVTGRWLNFSDNSVASLKEKSFATLPEGGVDEDLVGDFGWRGGSGLGLGLGAGGGVVELRSFNESGISIILGGVYFFLIGFGGGGGAVFCSKLAGVEAEPCPSAFTNVS